MASECSERELMCVLFPGMVNNCENAIKCLGGINSISEANSGPNVRLHLSFQPDNPYVKGTCASVKKTAGVLMKVKMKKTNVNGTIERKVVSTAIVGRVSKIFKFDAMCDFQYLPVQYNEGKNRSECLLEEIIPSKLTSTDFLSEPAPVYLPPPSFLRMDKPFSYNYSERTLSNKNTKERQEFRKAMLVSRVMFNLEDELPTEPNKLVYNSTQAKFKLIGDLAESDVIVKKALEERPVWTLSAITNHTGVRTPLLRLLLPCYGCYMFDGPWKKCWVRFGYDPRREPAARFFQVLDFRVRSSGGVSSIISRRGLLCTGAGVNNVVFRPGCLLTQRQVYYQYCDIKLPEVEELLAWKPEGALCHARRGWLAPGAHDAARDLIFKYAKEAALAAYAGADFKFERASSGDSDSEPEDPDDAA